MYKNEIISQAQNESNCSMKKTASEHYAGWSSMSVLITKNLILKKSKPAKYSLTDAGISLAMLLQKTKENNLSESSNKNTSPCSNLQSVKKSQNKLVAYSLESKESSNNLKFNDKMTMNLDLTIADLSNSISQTPSLIKNIPENLKEIDDIIIIDDGNNDRKLHKCNEMVNT
jgi:crossover junction endonuclease MUS81